MGLFKMAKSSSDVAKEDKEDGNGLPDSADEHPPDFDPSIEKRVRRKLDWHIVPLVFALCMSVSLESLGEADTTRPPRLPG